jgi:hypothetical protein
MDFLLLEYHIGVPSPRHEYLFSWDVDCASIFVGSFGFPGVVVPTFFPLLIDLVGRNVALYKVYG